MTISRESRFQGCLLGLATGDAVGTTVEFCPPGTFNPVHDMVGGGPFHLEAGQWTDDTSMALCLAESLVECGGFNARDQMKRYVRWWREGYWSSTDRCFDIGGTVHAALVAFEQTGEPYSGSINTRSAGNGSLMRLGPVPLFFSDDPTLAVVISAESSRTTHGARTCIDACRYFGGLIVGACQGIAKEILLSDRFAPMPGLWEADPLCEEIDSIARGSFKAKEPPEIAGTGYVVQSLEAALWAFHNSSDFREGCLLAVNLGDDADTTAAVYGQIAGTYYGFLGIPESWRQRLAHAQSIIELALRLSQQRTRRA